MPRSPRCFSQVKILVSMYQVQSGTSPTFDLTLPESLIRLLRFATIWEVNIPLDCVVHLNFYARMIYKTLWPLAAWVALMGVRFVTRNACSDLTRPCCDLSVALVLYLLQASARCGASGVRWLLHGPHELSCYLVW